MSNPIDLSHEGIDGSHHHIELDQEVFDAFLAQKHFRCTDCRHRYRMDKLGSVLIGAKKNRLHGVCETCEQQYADE